MRDDVDLDGGSLNDEMDQIATISGTGWIGL